MDSELVCSVLDRIFAAGKDDAQVIRQLARERPDVGPHKERRTLHDLPAQELAEVLSGVPIPVPRAAGELLYVLARACGARRVVEYGTSHGVSTIYLAAAVRDNGGGQVIGTELQPNKVPIAEANLVEARLDDLVEIRTGDARDTLRELPGPVDLLLVDGFASLYLEVLRLVEPFLAPGALVVADGMPEGPKILREYLDHVRNPANGYLSVSLPIGDGIELSLRTRNFSCTSRDRT
ncbi:O-methyltransferase [Longimycelium tulufanense]|uniref:O-methyltransferase n=1 Tax=Longimycelium tulufanense TaxID=907463 RepID=A0A8J3CDJ8_9PSEU|nr:O-methyltransferase [Longimycelium tulufanense]